MDTRSADQIDEIASAIGPGLLSTRQAAEALGVSKRTLEDWRLIGCGPAFVRMSPRAVRYRPRVVARWIAEREVVSTSDPGGTEGLR